jgi:hypothetical protein
MSDRLDELAKRTYSRREGLKLGAAVAAATGAGRFLLGPATANASDTCVDSCTPSFHQCKATAGGSYYNNAIDCFVPSLIPWFACLAINAYHQEVDNGNCNQYYAGCVGNCNNGQPPPPEPSPSASNPSDCASVGGFTCPDGLSGSLCCTLPCCDPSGIGCSFDCGA